VVPSSAAALVVLLSRVLMTLADLGWALLAGARGGLRSRASDVAAGSAGTGADGP
jgi:hypothetical protein